MKKRTIEDFIFEDFQSMKRFSYYIIRKLLEDAYQVFLNGEDVDFKAIHNALSLLEQQQEAARPGRVSAPQKKAPYRYQPFAEWRSANRRL